MLTLKKKEIKEQIRFNNKFLSTKKQNCKQKTPSISKYSRSNVLSEMEAGERLCFHQTEFLDCLQVRFHAEFITMIHIQGCWVWSNLLSGVRFNIPTTLTQDMIFSSLSCHSSPILSNLGALVLAALPYAHCCNGPQPRAVSQQKPGGKSPDINQITCCHHFD